MFFFIYFYLSLKLRMASAGPKACEGSWWSIPAWNTHQKMAAPRVLTILTPIPKGSCYSSLSLPTSSSHRGPWSWPLHPGCPTALRSPGRRPTTGNSCGQMGKGKARASSHLLILQEGPFPYSAKVAPHCILQKQEQGNLRSLSLELFQAMHCTWWHGAELLVIPKPGPCAKHQPQQRCASFPHLFPASIIKQCKIEDCLQGWMDGWMDDLGFGGFAFQWEGIIEKKEQR